MIVHSTPRSRLVIFSRSRRWSISTILSASRLSVVRQPFSEPGAKFRAERSRQSRVDSQYVDQYQFAGRNNLHQPSDSTHLAAPSCDGGRLARLRFPQTVSHSSVSLFKTLPKLNLIIAAVNIQALKIEELWETYFLKRRELWWHLPEKKIKKQKFQSIYLVITSFLKLSYDYHPEKKRRVKDKIKDFLGQFLFL